MSIRAKVLREIEKKPRRLKDLKEKLGNDKKVQRAVEELLAQGKITQKEGAYFPAKAGLAENARPATLVKLGAGFGFATQADGPDVFVPGRALCGALPGDEVLIHLFERPRVAGSCEGEILAVTKPRAQFVGTVLQEGSRLLFALDDCAFLRIPVKKSATGGALPGEKVAVELLARGVDYPEHRAGVTMCFGSAGRARHCVRALLHGAGLSRTFPEKVKAEAHGLPPLQEQEFKKRMDLRSWSIFTIDSAETKDIDDAISLSVTPAGYQLGVHIADVSHYVRPGTQLNAEALHRGTSVYYADSVISMLPRRLSNDLCSLNPGQDRLALSCLMQLDQKGEVQSYKFEKTVIRSRVKGVYDELNGLIGGAVDEDIQEKYADFVDTLDAILELYEKRAALRKARGGIELETGEAKLVLNSEGVCVAIKKRERGLTECVIEEFMLLANGCAAHLARTQKLPFVYRVHESPDPARVEKLRDLLKACGVPCNFGSEIPSQTQLAVLLNQTRGTPLERVVHTGVLRTMAKARYEPTAKGHYGLALQDYAHFTSPIRRYADLAVHRVIGDFWAGIPAAELHTRYEKFVATASEEASQRELAAMQLERAATDCYKAEYLHEHLGESFAGVISGITAQGLFVELENTAEGFVRADRFCKGEAQLTEGVRLRDGLTGRQWSLGGPVKVKVLSADVAAGRVDFDLVQE